MHHSHMELGRKGEERGWVGFSVFCFSHQGRIVEEEGRLNRHGRERTWKGRGEGRGGWGGVAFAIVCMYVQREPWRS